MYITQKLFHFNTYVIKIIVDKEGFLCFNEDTDLHIEKEVLPDGNEYICVLRSVLRVSAAPPPYLERKAKGKQETHIRGPEIGPLMCSAKN